MIRQCIITRCIWASLLFGPIAQARGPSSTLARLGSPASGSEQAPSPVINGEDATADEFPMTGALVYDLTMSVAGKVFETRDFLCSSTLIAPDTVLTAAHCLDTAALTLGVGTVDSFDLAWTREADLSVYDWTRTDTTWPKDTINIKATGIHPAFSLVNLEQGLTENFDIALAFLTEPVEGIQPAIVPTSSEGGRLTAGEEVTVVGWGTQAAPSMSGPPRDGAFKIKQQGVSSVGDLAAFEFQVGVEASDARKCHGDSGGPTFAWLGEGTTDSMRVVGVTSHAYDESDCDTGGVDTRVDYYLNWIDSEMRARCEDGTRVWCDVPGILPPEYFSEDDTTSTTNDTAVGDDSNGDDTGRSPGEGPRALGAEDCGCSAAVTPASMSWLLPLLCLAMARREAP